MAGSHLERHIRQKVAQRDSIDLAARWLAGEEGVIVEFGLGLGRSYSHLLERFPGRPVFCFDRRDTSHPRSRPPAGHFYCREFADALADPEVRARFRGHVILLHLDVGCGGPEDAELPAFLLEATHPWLRPRAVVLSDLELPLQGHWGLARVDTAREVEHADQYFVYRRAGGERLHPLRPGLPGVPGLAGQADELCGSGDAGSSPATGY